MKPFVVRVIATGAVIYCGRCVKSANHWAAVCASPCTVQYPDGRIVAVAQFAEPTGQQAYEADVAVRPLYHDGAPRSTWANLSEIAQWSWNRRVAREAVQVAEVA